MFDIPNGSIENVKMSFLACVAADSGAWKTRHYLLFKRILSSNIQPTDHSIQNLPNSSSPEFHGDFFIATSVWAQKCTRMRRGLTFRISCHTDAQPIKQRIVLFFATISNTSRHIWLSNGKSNWSVGKMSMIPLFPSLRPSVSSSICFDVDQPCDDESELREMEKEYDVWVSEYAGASVDTFSHHDITVTSCFFAVECG